MSQNTLANASSALLNRKETRNIIRNAKIIFLKVLWDVTGILNFGGADDTKSARYEYNRSLDQADTDNPDVKQPKGICVGVPSSKNTKTGKCNNNAKYGKCNIYKRPDGTYEIRVKCSGGKIRTFIFGANSNNNILTDLESFVRVRSTINNILRGSMDTIGANVHRDSCVITTDGEPVANPTLIDGTQLEGNIPVMVMDTRNTSGSRDETSFFLVESAGKYYIESDIVIDLSRLAWFSMSDVRGMRQIPHEVEYQMAEAIRKNVGQETLEIKKYLLKNGTSVVPETGILLNETGIENCLNQLFKWIKCGYGKCTATNYLMFAGYTKASVITESGEYDIDPTDGVKVESVDLEYVVAENSDRDIEAEYLAEVERLKQEAKDKKDAKNAAKEAAKEAAKTAKKSGKNA